MDSSQIIVSLTVVIASILFIFEFFSVDLIALLSLLTLLGTGILTPEEAFQGFANPAVITIASLFIVSEGLLKTGAVTFVGRKIIDISGGDTRKILMLSMIVVGLFSIFVNNTPIVIIFIPIMLGIASENKISPSKLLMPISFASMFGGTCSLIGTSTNILVSNISEKSGQGALTMFEFSKLGLIFFFLGIIYMSTIGRKLLPDHPIISTYQDIESQKDYVTEIEVSENSPLIGSRLLESNLVKKYNITIFEIIRGEEIIWPPLDNVYIMAGDILLFKGDINDLVNLKQETGVRMLPELEEAELKFTRKDARLAELLIPSGSEYIDRTISDLKLKARYDITVLGIQRRGVHLRSKISDIRLKVGDILLVYGTQESIANLGELEYFVLMEGVHKAIINRNKAPIAIIIMFLVALLLTLQLFPTPVITLAAAIAMVMTGCLSPKQAYKSLNLPILILIAGILSLGTGLAKTGLDVLVAHGLVELTKPYGPWMVLAAFYILTSLLTAFLSNNAVAILLTPIAIATAVSLGVNPKPFIIAVTFGASASFATPIGYQTNLLVYGPGNYSFMDYVRVGLPLNLVFIIIASILIPIFWPF